LSGKIFTAEDAGAAGSAPDREQTMVNLDPDLLLLVKKRLKVMMLVIVRGAAIIKPAANSGHSGLIIRPVGIFNSGQYSRKNIAVNGVGREIAKFGNCATGTWRVVMTVRFALVENTAAAVLF
jgi:hypothetical protein